MIIIDRHIRDHAVLLVCTTSAQLYNYLQLQICFYGLLQSPTLFQLVDVHYRNSVTQSHDVDGLLSMPKNSKIQECAYKYTQFCTI